MYFIYCSYFLGACMKLLVFLCLFQVSSIANVPVIVPILWFFCSSSDALSFVLPFLFLLTQPQHLYYCIDYFLKPSSFLFHFFPKIPCWLTYQFLSLILKTSFLFIYKLISQVLCFCLKYHNSFKSLEKWVQTMK